MAQKRAGSTQYSSSLACSCDFSQCNGKLLRHAKQWMGRNLRFPMTPQPNGVIRSLGLEKAVPGPRQPKILSQGDAFVFASKDISCLQFGNNLVDEIVESARQIGEHYVEAIRSVLREPLLHLVRNHSGRADHFKPRITADPLRKLTDREMVAARPFDHPLAAAFACVGFRYLRQRPVGVEA